MFSTYECEVGINLVGMAGWLGLTPAEKFSQGCCEVEAAMTIFIELSTTENRSS